MNRGKGRRSSNGEGGWAAILWTEDGETFKMDQENVGLSDENVGEWITDVRKELEKWPAGHGLVCTSLNLSRNDLGDRGVFKILRFWTKMRVSVLLLKLYKNWIGDDGLRAIGDFIYQAPEPVQEIHLSHNQIGWWGALAIFEAVRESGRYPCNRGKDGTPLWLRLENNAIDWEPVLRKLEDWQFRWSSGDTRDSWKTQPRGAAEADACPLVAMHHSYRHQVLSRATAWDGNGASHGGLGGRGLERGWGEKGKSHGGTAEGSPWVGSSGWRQQGTGKASLEGAADLQETRRHIDKVLQQFNEQQNKKFELIFSVLGELKTRQAELENSVHEVQHLMQQPHPPTVQYAAVQQPHCQQHQQAPYAAVQILPMEGAGPQQPWGSDGACSNGSW